MALKPIVIQGADCQARVPEPDCRQRVVVIGTESEAVTIWQRDGWGIRTIGWLCPPCLAAYDRAGGTP